MKTTLLAVALIWVIASSNPAQAHPVPYSYIDIQLRPDVLEISLVAHIYDLAHDLNVTPMERLLDPAEVSRRGDAIRRLISSRAGFEINGAPVTPTWGEPEALTERQSIRLQFRQP